MNRESQANGSGKQADLRALVRRQFQQSETRGSGGQALLVAEREKPALTGNEINAEGWLQKWRRKMGRESENVMHVEKPLFKALMHLQFAEAEQGRTRARSHELQKEAALLRGKLSQNLH